MSYKKYPNLKNAPIKIAIFEIRFNSDIVEFPPQLKSFDETTNKLFPIFKTNVNKNIQINDLPNGETSVNITSQEVNQIRYFSKDKTKVLSITKDRFILNVNNTYTNWEDYIKLFKELWSNYHELILKNNCTLIRASIRYINHIEIIDLVTPNDYFKTTIYADDNVIPGEVNSFLFRYNTKIKQENTQINVVQGFEPPIGNKTIYLFDVDVISIKKFSEQELWEKFDRLRELKNQTFFNNLTEKALNIIL